MRLDYNVETSKPVEKEEEKNKNSVKTRTSMQNTVMSALMSKQAGQPQTPPMNVGPVAQGWGQTGV